MLEGIPPALRTVVVVPGDNRNLKITYAEDFALAEAFISEWRMPVPALIRWASQHGYEAMLEAGMRIYEYQPAMMHAKTVVVDGQWSVVGSANMDVRSKELNQENALGILDVGFARQGVDGSVGRPVARRRLVEMPGDGQVERAGGGGKLAVDLGVMIDAEAIGGLEQPEAQFLSEIFAGAHRAEPAPEFGFLRFEIVPDLEVVGQDVQNGRIHAGRRSGGKGDGADR